MSSLGSSASLRRHGHKSLPPLVPLPTTLQTRSTRTRTKPIHTSTRKKHTHIPTIIGTLPNVVAFTSVSSPSHQGQSSLATASRKPSPITTSSGGAPSHSSNIIVAVIVTGVSVAVFTVAVMMYIMRRRGRAFRRNTMIVAGS